VANLLAIPNEMIVAPAQATKGIPIAKAENTIYTTMDNIFNTIASWVLQMSKVTEPRNRGYQRASMFAIQTDHQLL